MSGDAEVDAKPQLEIYANDVKCAHGCTVGQLDEEALFYLRTRAIDATVARNLLVYAFAADVLERIRVKPLRRLLETQLTGRLMNADVPERYAIMLSLKREAKVIIRSTSSYPPISSRIVIVE